MAVFVKLLFETSANEMIKVRHLKIAFLEIEKVLIRTMQLGLQLKSFVLELLIRLIFNINNL